MIRPFKSVSEFKDYAGVGIKDIIHIVSRKDDESNYMAVITGFDYSKNIVTIGNISFTLNELCEKFCYRDKQNNLQPFGIDEPDKVKRPAKFKVGKSYSYCSYRNNEWEIFINAKYKDPHSNKVTAVTDGATISTVNTDRDGNEYITFCNGELSAKNEVIK